MNISIFNLERIINNKKSIKKMSLAAMTEDTQEGKVVSLYDRLCIGKIQILIDDVNQVREAVIEGLVPADHGIAEIERLTRESFQYLKRIKKEYE